MKKKVFGILFSFILISSFFIYGVYAQDTLTSEPVAPIEPVVAVDETPNIQPEDLTEDEKVAVLVEEAQGFDEELSVEAGITPDSGLYFVEDKILAPFRDDSVNRERKIAEMQAMMQEGNTESARIAFERYQKYAKKFEQGVSPEQRDEALRSSERIRGVAIKEIAQNMPAGEKDEFVREIVLGEQDIEIAAEIASKISELCSQLSKLDPSQYAKVCSAGEDDSDWRKNLDKRLTDEQKAEALKFGEIMSKCFETSGQDCACEEIPYPDFAEACSVAAPLAKACDFGKNEEACEQLDNLEMPIDNLPDYLQEIFNNLESGMNEAKYDMYLPKECQEAGAESPSECSKIMIQTHAPEECRQVLLDTGVQSEREGRELCNKIMFEKNAPPECVSAGATSPQECGKIMFKLNAPQECVDAGIDGTGRDDSKKCQQVMMSQFGGGEFGVPSCKPGTDCSGPGGYAQGTGPNMARSGGDCAGISDSQERLKCYDGAGQYIQEFRDGFEENRIDQPRQEFKDGQDYQQQYPNQFRQDDFNNQQPFGDFKGGNFIPPQGFQQPGQYGQYPQPPQGFDPSQFSQGMMPPQDYQQYNQQPPTGYQSPTTTTTPTTTTEPTSGTTTTTSTTEPAPSPSTSTEPSAPSSEPAPVTGGVISNNKFLRFWFWR